MPVWQIFQRDKGFKKRTEKYQTDHMWLKPEAFQTVRAALIPQNGISEKQRYKKAHQQFTKDLKVLIKNTSD